MLDKLPFKYEVETKEILRLAAKTSASLGELKGICKIIPNEQILLNLLPLQEAKSSSEIENIFTTQDDLHIARIDKRLQTPATKEVQSYVGALMYGFSQVSSSQQLNNKTIIDIQKKLLNTNHSFRIKKGTVIGREDGSVIYIPPQDNKHILDLMGNLEQFINDNSFSEYDPLIKMAIIHHQFETIHPFYDGNGRVGRIINILYLYKQGYLDLPILYLSRYIIRQKNEYYRLLQEVRDKHNWQDWIVFILKGIFFTSIETIHFISRIKILMEHYKKTIRLKLPQIYSQDLIDALFKYPYTKISFISKDLNKSRITVTKYLDKLTEYNLLKKVSKGRTNYYFNNSLIDLSLQVIKDTENIFYDD